MSIMHCHKHGLSYDSDFGDCSGCEHEEESDMRYKIKAHYGNNSVICGYVNAQNAAEALRVAEDQGLFDQRDGDWDDVSAIAVPAPSQSPSHEPAK